MFIEMGYSVAGARPHQLGTVTSSYQLTPADTGINVAPPPGTTVVVTPPVVPSPGQAVVITNTGNGTVGFSGALTDGNNYAELAHGASITISWTGTTWTVIASSGTVTYSLTAALNMAILPYLSTGHFKGLTQDTLQYLTFGSNIPVQNFAFNNTTGLVYRISGTDWIMTPVLSDLTYGTPVIIPGVDFDPLYYYSIFPISVGYSIAAINAANTIVYLYIFDHSGNLLSTADVTALGEQFTSQITICSNCKSSGFDRIAKFNAEFSYFKWLTANGNSKGLLTVLTPDWQWTDEFGGNTYGTTALLFTGYALGAAHTDGLFYSFTNDNKIFFLPWGGHVINDSVLVMTYSSTTPTGLARITQHSDGCVYHERVSGNTVRATKVTKTGVQTVLGTYDVIGVITDFANWPDQFAYGVSLN